MIPTEANVLEVAWSRVKAIRARARELGDVDSSDDRLVGIVYRQAMQYACRDHSPPRTAQAAVAWAIADMHTVDVSIDVSDLDDVEPTHTTLVRVGASDLPTSDEVKR